jgi:hypothetical protein
MSSRPSSRVQLTLGQIMIGIAVTAILTPILIGIAHFVWGIYILSRFGS